MSTLTAKEWVLKQHPSARGEWGRYQGRYHVIEHVYGHELGYADTPGEAWAQAAWWIRWNRGSRAERVAMEEAKRRQQHVYPRRVCV